MVSTSIRQFYSDLLGGKVGPELEQFLSQDSASDIGHFNVFDIAETYQKYRNKQSMPYNRRTYYKISLIHGHNMVEYADKRMEVLEKAILFATPKIPYRYVPLSLQQGGKFCVFTEDFMNKSKSGFYIDDFPIFKPNSPFVFRLDDAQFERLTAVFFKMQQEMMSDYAYKYDLLRNYVLELIHEGQKLQPLNYIQENVNASSRIAALFIELLERQFPIESVGQVIQLKTAKDYSERLQVHVNHLNKVLKEVTGKSTTEIIASRIVQEAKILLRQSIWNVSEIAFALGFEEVAHFSNFFKKHTGLAPLSYRA